jgi:hypothetical protein
MTRKMLVALFVAAVGLAAPVIAAVDCCTPGAPCCDAPCCH